MNSLLKRTIPGENRLLELVSFSYAIHWLSVDGLSVSSRKWHERMLLRRRRGVCHCRRPTWRCSASRRRRVNPGDELGGCLLCFIKLSCCDDRVDSLRMFLTRRLHRQQLDRN